MDALRRFKAVLLPLCAACLVISLWMVYHSLSGVPMAGCAAGSSCDSVMGSPWAYVLGRIPVSLPAAVLYALLLLCVLFLGGKSEDSRSLDKFLWRLMPLLGGCIVGAALWFIWLQAGVLHAFCRYCSTLHLLGCVVAVIVFVKAQREGFRPLPLFLIGLALAAAFAVVQAHTKPDNIYDAGQTAASLPTFEEGEVPMLGDSGSGAGMTLLFDFQCTHCRRLHRLLPELAEKGGYRILLCPVPLSSACNPYIPSSGIDRFAGSCQLTRFALAVWYARPDAYVSFWNWLLGDGDPKAQISPLAAEQRVREILGDGFETAMADPRIDTYLRKAEELFGRTSTSKKSGVPRFIGGQRWLVPETDDTDALLALIRTELGF